jgi:hypothetical protein
MPAGTRRAGAVRTPVKPQSVAACAASRGTNKDLRAHDLAAPDASDAMHLAGRYADRQVPPHVWMAPDLQEFFRVMSRWSLAVMCPAFRYGLI